eukprot:TRINITY_DN1783_c0_g2_i1.p1 TRINITY_DN1783_c0_g2~~TRINITY_DN1783_c0_g2_i1.p1  ORF type:complete len:266 (+),score=66.55 TRINITY_DN1783_c0_g2_i1:178-975(+)
MRVGFSFVFSIFYLLLVVESIVGQSINLADFFGEVAQEEWAEPTESSEFDPVPNSPVSASMVLYIRGRNESFVIDTNLAYSGDVSFEDIKCDVEGEISIDGDVDLSNAQFRFDNRLSAEMFILRRDSSVLFSSDSSVISISSCPVMNGSVALSFNETFVNETMRSNSSVELMSFVCDSPPTFQVSTKQCDGRSQWGELVTKTVAGLFVSFTECERSVEPSSTSTEEEITDYQVSQNTDNNIDNDDNPSNETLLIVIIASAVGVVA